MACGDIMYSIYYGEIHEYAEDVGVFLFLIILSKLLFGYLSYLEERKKYEPKIH